MNITKIREFLENTSSGYGKLRFVLDYLKQSPTLSFTQDCIIITEVFKNV